MTCQQISNFNPVLPRAPFGKISVFLEKNPSGKAVSGTYRLSITIQGCPYLLKWGGSLNKIAARLKKTKQKVSESYQINIIICDVIVAGHSTSPRHSAILFIGLTCKNQCHSSLPTDD
jgi:hypothetical protein